MKTLCQRSVLFALLLLATSAIAQSEVTQLGLTKTRNYDQTAAGTTSLYDFSMSAFISGTQLSGSFPSASNRFQRSGSPTSTLAFQSNYGNWRYQDYYATQAELDAAFPNTTYSFLVGTSPAISLSFGANNYPVVPVVTASAGTWNGGNLLISPAQAASGFTLTSNVSDGNGFLTMDVMSPTQTILSNVIPFNTGAPIVVNVPSGSLTVGESYDVTTEFDQVINSTSVSTQTWAAAEGAGFTLNSSNTTFVMQVMTEAEAWRLQFFSVITNTGDAADDYDYDKDGLPNLLEWACHLNPTTASKLPASGTRNGANFEYTYTRSVAAVNAGTTFTVEWSDTLPGTSWSSAGVTEQVLSDDGTEQQVKATLPAGSAGHRFVHLKVAAYVAPIE